MWIEINSNAVAQISKKLTEENVIKNKMFVRLRRLFQIKAADAV